MKDKIDKTRILLLVCGIIVSIIAAIFFSTLSKSGQNPIYLQAGILDLKSWEPENNGVLTLNGQWDFYWKRYLSYQDLISDSPEPDVTAVVPSVWNSYKINGKRLPGYGYGTYHLKVINAQSGKPLALGLPAFSTAYALYINGQLAASNGKVGSDKENFSPDMKPKELVFTPEQQSFDIIVHVANFIYAEGGMCYSIKLGTSEQIQNMDKAAADRDMFLFGALIIMAFYYICFYLFWREDRSPQYVALTCILLAGMTAISGDYLVYRIIPFISFQALIAIYYIFLCWFSVCIAFVLRELFPEESSKMVLKIAFVCSAALTLLVLLTPVSFYSEFYNIILAAAIFVGVYCIYVSAAAFLKGRKDSFLLYILGLPLIVLRVYDIFFLSDSFRLGYFIILFAHPVLLAKRSSETLKNLSDLSQKLIKQDKIKDEFLANTSHELRTPLNGIIGITEAMLAGSAGELSIEQNQNLSIIVSSGRRLANIINDILDYSMMRISEIRLDIRTIRIEGLINNVVSVFQQLSKQKEYDVIAEIEEGLPPVTADENRVMQVLYNLVGNAVKYTVRGFVKVSAKKAGDMLEICVSDTGEGIPADKLEDIFEPFVQVEDSLTRRHGGSGLGLSIAKQLVELQGGSIRVESNPSAGSRFYFTLPVATNAPEEIWENMPLQQVTSGMEEIGVIGNAGSFQTEDNTTDKGSIRLLLVDDDTINLQAATAILKLAGYAVTSSSSGKSALEKLERRSDFSLVILDIMMPEMSGYEVCRKIRESKSAFELPVLMLTAKSSVEDIVMGFDVGANDYLPKPFEPEELLARVRTLTNLKMSVDRAMAAEIAFMQSQIKPHFLYNTLNAISSLCNTDPDRAQRLIDDFSNYLRQSFDFKNLEMHVPLERELSLVNSYLKIEKARFGDDLQVVFDIDSTIKVKVPLLSIQPLVENAVVHGLRKRDGCGTVTLSVHNVDAGVLVSVADDGPGIPEDKLKTLLAPEAGKGIGLWNIDRRLKSHFGKGLQIESSYDRGTRVSYIIPSEVV